MFCVELLIARIFLFKKHIKPELVWELRWCFARLSGAFGAVMLLMHVMLFDAFGEGPRQRQRQRQDTDRGRTETEADTAKRHHKMGTADRDRGRTQTEVGQRQR